jgi:hypothetical protein
MEIDPRICVTHAWRPRLYVVGIKSRFIAVTRMNSVCDASAAFGLSFESL